MRIPQWLQPLSRFLRWCTRGARRLWCRLAFWRACECRPKGVTLGRYVRGAKNLPIGVDGEFVLPLDLLRQHVVILGSEFEEQNRLASLLIEGVAREDPYAQVFCLDADADLEMTALYEAAVVKAGRRPFVFPQRPFNAWTGGDWHLVSNRLIEQLAEARSGMAAFHNDVAARIVQLACRAKDEPPRSHRELLQRLNYRTLCEEHGAEQLRGIEPEHVEAVYISCAALFVNVDTALDGEESFSDLDSAYFSFDPLMMGLTAKSIIRMLLSQLLDYVQHEKDPSRLCMVLIRVPAALVGEVNQAALVERARKHGVVLVWIYSTLAEAGDETQVARTLYGTGTLLGHSRVFWSELKPMVGPAGPMELIDSVPAWSSQGSGSILTKNRLLRVPPTGEVFVIHNGAVTLVDASPQASS